MHTTVGVELVDDKIVRRKKWKNKQVVLIGTKQVSSEDFASEE